MRENKILKLNLRLVQGSRMINVYLLVEFCWFYLLIMYKCMYTTGLCVKQVDVVVVWQEKRLDRMASVLVLDRVECWAE